MPTPNGLTVRGLARVSGFSALKFSDFPAPAGSWFSLLDSDTRFSLLRPDHRWMLYLDFDPGRHVFAHGCPRSTSDPRPGNVFFEHPAHDAKHESGCMIDLDARVYVSSRRPVEPTWLDHGRYSCLEPSSEFVAKVQGAIREATA